MTVATVLRRMIAAFQNNEFCTGRSARDANGIGCDPRDPAATQWCTIGLMSRFCAGDWRLQHAVNDVVKRAAKELWGSSFLTCLNDNEMFGRDAMIVTFSRALKQVEGAPRPRVELEAAYV